MNDMKIRRTLWLDSDDEEQDEVIKFIDALPRGWSELIAKMIRNKLLENGITDPQKLTKEEAKKIASSDKSIKDIIERNIRLQPTVKEDSETPHESGQETTAPTKQAEPTIHQESKEVAPNTVAVQSTPVVNNEQQKSSEDDYVNDSMASFMGNFGI